MHYLLLSLTGERNTLCCTFVHHATRFNLSLLKYGKIMLYSSKSKQEKGKKAEKSIYFLLYLISLAMRVMVSDDDENMDVDKGHKNQWCEKAAGKERSVRSFPEKIVYFTTTTLKPFSRDTGVVNENHSDWTYPGKKYDSPRRPSCHCGSIMKWSYDSYPVVHGQGKEMTDCYKNPTLSVTKTKD